LPLKKGGIGRFPIALVESLQRWHTPTRTKIKQKRERQRHEYAEIKSAEEQGNRSRSRRVCGWFGVGGCLKESQEQGV
jgi:hypothetical protein